MRMWYDLDSQMLPIIMCVYILSGKFHFNKYLVVPCIQDKKIREGLISSNEMNVSQTLILNN